jgi:hypothetical protein
MWQNGGCTPTPHRLVVVDTGHMDQDPKNQRWSLKVFVLRVNWSSNIETLLLLQGFLKAGVTTAPAL